MQNDLIPTRGVCLANSSYLRDYFKLKNVKVYLNTKVKEITDSGVIAIADEHEITIPGDTKILCIGYDANPLNHNFDLVGDCYEVGNLMTVITRAWDVAMKK